MGEMNVLPLFLSLMGDVSTGKDECCARVFVANEWACFHWEICMLCLCFRR